MMRWQIDVPGWRYTRRWTIGLRRGEWWIGVRWNLACDWWEIGLLGLTVCIPAGKTLRRPVRPPANAWYVPADVDWCPRCSDVNYDEARMCITCTHGDDAYADGAYTNGWPGYRPEVRA